LLKGLILVNHVDDDVSAAGTGVVIGIGVDCYRILIE
jgi:hypothetical protein